MRSQLVKNKSMCRVAWASKASPLGSGGGAVETREETLMGRPDMAVWHNHALYMAQGGNELEEQLSVEEGKTGCAQKK
jgi:hypothetical protein